MTKQNIVIPSLANIRFRSSQCQNPFDSLEGVIIVLLHEADYAFSIIPMLPVNLTRLCHEYKSRSFPLGPRLSM